MCFFLSTSEPQYAHAHAKALKLELEKKLNSACLISIEVVLEVPNAIPRSEGKAIRVIDHRKNTKEGIIK
ncbi:hypothetical protein P5F74_10350 [Shouchella miscanthi]|uniref:AMP-dependent ligase C-terminal domain-containing protein n=1 Tax=Shouchella miscanthi TaxID=2598861 RepID=A0ABU6NJY6_9BACI|nr:hypothetical protein [Shouchella miscanthi]